MLPDTNARVTVMNFRLRMGAVAAVGLVSVAPAGGTEPAPERPPIFVERGNRDSAATPSPVSKPAARPASSPAMRAKISTVIRQSVGYTAGGTVKTLPDSPDIVKMKPMVVREAKLPEFKEREILTEKGKMALARRRYPGTDAASARQLLEEDFTIERRNEMKELLELDGEFSRELRGKLYDAMIRK